MAESAQQRYYSPWQICVGAILGSPLAAGYFGSRNYVLFKAPSKAMAALLVSAAVLLARVAVGYSMPEGASGTIPAAIVAGLYRWHAQVAFASDIARSQSDGWKAHSWWRVITLSLGILVALLVLAFLVLLFFGHHAA